MRLILWLPVFVYLCSSTCKAERQRQRNIFNRLFHSPSDFNNQGWARQNQELKIPLGFPTGRAWAQAQGLASASWMHQEEAGLEAQISPQSLPSYMGCKQPEQWINTALAAAPDTVVKQRKRGSRLFKSRKYYIHIIEKLSRAIM